MTKLIWGILSSFILIFIVWLCVGYGIYGEQVLTKHLDLATTFNNMFDIPKPNTEQFSQIFIDFNNGFSKVGDYAKEFLAWTDSDWGVFEALKMIFTGISYIARTIYYIYNIVNFLVNLVSIFVNYVSYACNLLVNIIVCLFNPVFR